MIDELLEFLRRILQGMTAIAAIFSPPRRKALLEQWRTSKLKMFEECFGAMIGLVLLILIGGYMFGL